MTMLPPDLETIFSKTCKKISESRRENSFSLSKPC